MMMVEKTGKTIDEAIDQALKEMGIERQEAEIEVLEEPTKGFLGFLGGRPARVKVYIKPPNPEKEAEEYLNKVLNSMGLKAEIKIEKEQEHLKVDLSCPDGAILIGRRGETLDALQYLLSLAVNKKTPGRIRVIMDVEGYREKRAQSLNLLAKRISEKVQRTGDRVVLEPMTPQERRLIHTALQNDQRVVTFSEGEEPYRKVVIAPKK